MKKFKNVLSYASSSVKRYRLLLPIVLIAGLIIIVTAHAQSSVPYRFELVPTSDTIAACLPRVAASVTVLPKEDSRGVDTLDVKAEGLPATTAFAVFLTELPQGPFGAAEYIGDFTTNAAGRGSLRVDTVIEEAFSTTTVEGTRVRKELNHIVIWFAEPSADDFCFAPGTGPTTPFDGDGQAGGTVLSSKQFLPGSPLP
jgi:hypothetical protein